MTHPSTVFLRVFIGNYKKEIMNKGAPHNIIISVLFIFPKQVLEEDKTQISRGSQVMFVYTLKATLCSMSSLRAKQELRNNWGLGIGMEQGWKLGT